MYIIIMYRYIPQGIRGSFATDIKCGQKLFLQKIHIHEHMSTSPVKHKSLAVTAYFGQITEQFSSHECHASLVQIEYVSRYIVHAFHPEAS